MDHWGVTRGVVGSSERMNQHNLVVLSFDHDESAVIVEVASAARTISI